MADAKVEKQLQEFLEWQETARRDGKTIEGLHDKQDRMLVTLRRVTKDRLEDRETISRHGRAIKTLQHQVGLLTEVTPAVPNWRAAKDEITGVHDVAAIQKATKELEARLDEDAKREREEETWWRRQRWIWGIALAGGMLAILMTGCVGYVAYRIQTIEKTLNEDRQHERPKP